MSVVFDEKYFFDAVRCAMFNCKLSTTQVNNLLAIKDEFAKGNADLRHLAYIFATVYHETGRLIEPVREGFAKTDAQAIQHVTNMFASKQISKNYAAPGPNGQSFFGRGYVQLTWDFNYRNMSNLLYVDLYNNPSLALDPIISAQILVKGMEKGSFTGKKLNDYFTAEKTDYIGARKIINGTDKAELIAGYATKFYNALTQQ